MIAGSGFVLVPGLVGCMHSAYSNPFLPISCTRRRREEVTDLNEQWRAHPIPSTDQTTSGHQVCQHLLVCSVYLVFTRYACCLEIRGDTLRACQAATSQCAASLPSELRLDQIRGLSITFQLSRG